MNEPICQFSLDKKYRYTLWREVNPDGAGTIAFIGLNPSTADEANNDPTIRRCMGFAKDWGARWLCMLNVFAFRATDPKVMKLEDDPFGQDNHHHILRVTSIADKVIAAWGIHGCWMNGDINVKQWLIGINIPLYCLGKTKEGHPKHPLYIKASTVPTTYL